MKVLWFTNVIIPRVARHLSMQEEVFSYTWLTGLSECLLCSGDIELAAAFPMLGQKTIISGKAGSLEYFGFPWKKSDFTKYNRKVEEYAETIIKRSNPDIIHLFGTEDYDKLAVVNACERLGVRNRVVASIQGMSSVMPNHYYAGLPVSIINKYTLRDFIRQDNIRQHRNALIKSGKSEIEVIAKVQHIIGRTDWDKACTFRINPGARYHFCNETLRGEFYTHSWDIAKCERHSIFMSQAYYPVKGLHLALDALPDILKRFPGAHLYIAGSDITRTDTLMSKIKLSSYGKYIKSQIRNKGLQEHITFTGILNEKAMCDMYLKAHVYILPSSTENSSNSLGEAMILGVPSVASDVGGVKNAMKYGEEGFYYQYDAPYMLAHYVCEIFGDDDIALKFSKNAKKHAAVTHDREQNTQRVIEIYKDIAQS